MSIVTSRDLISAPRAIRVYASRVSFLTSFSFLASSNPSLLSPGLVPSRSYF
jgi:hypothetical protein